MLAQAPHVVTAQWQRLQTATVSSTDVNENRPSTTVLFPSHPGSNLICQPGRGALPSRGGRLLPHLTHVPDAASLVTSTASHGADASAFSRLAVLLPLSFGA